MEQASKQRQLQGLEDEWARKLESLKISRAQCQTVRRDVDEAMVHVEQARKQAEQWEIQYSYTRTQVADLNRAKDSAACVALMECRKLQECRENYNELIRSMHSVHHATIASISKFRALEQQLDEAISARVILLLVYLLFCPNFGTLE